MCRADVAVAETARAATTPSCSLRGALHHWRAPFFGSGRAPLWRSAVGLRV